MEAPSRGEIRGLNAALLERAAPRGRLLRSPSRTLRSRPILRKPAAANLWPELRLSAVGELGKLDSVGRPRLVQHVRDVHADGLLTEHQFPGDLAVRAP